VLLYHRIADGEPDPLGLCVSPAHFQQQLDVLSAELDVVGMAQLAERVRAGEGLGGLAAITFDDGYVDNADVAGPALEAAGLPATLFASTGHIAERRRFFWDETWRLICGGGSRPPRLDLAVDGVTGSWATGDAAEREDTYRWLHGLIQPRSIELIDEVLARLAEWAGEQAPAPPASTLPMDVGRLRALAAQPGIEIGAHTRNHVNLGHQAAEVVRAEVVGSRDDVQAWTGAHPAGFSFPFGLPRHDVSAAARAEVEAAGFAYAVVNQPVPVEPGEDVYALPRVFAPDLGADGFRDWLRQVLR
jgi:peptidoglycan/xylan/chitin deacetylase (PgdA/CDA1 family)